MWLALYSYVSNCSLKNGLCMCPRMIWLSSSYEEWQEHFKVPEVSDDGNWPVTHPLTTCSQEIYVSKWETSQGTDAAGNMHVWECSMPGLSEPTSVIVSRSSKPTGQPARAQFYQEPSPLLPPLPHENCWSSLFTPTTQTQCQKQPKNYEHRLLIL